MSTTLTFAGVLFQGIVTKAPEGELRGAVDRSGVAGLNGVDEITMGKRGIEIVADVFLKGFNDDVALMTYVVGTLTPLLQTNAVLAFAGGLTRTYAGTTFDSLEPYDRPTTQAHDNTLKRVQTYRCRFYCLNP